MSNRFEEVMPHVFLWEGGYVDHPNDPGGATNMGITIGTLSRWRGRDVSKQEVKDLTKEEATSIYKTYCWDAVRASEMPSPVDYVAMDAGVNSGPRRAIRWLQMAVGVSVDGILGPVTLGAINSHPNPKKLASEAVDRREAFLRGLSTWPHFGRGWMNRINHVRNIIDQT